LIEASYNHCFKLLDFDRCIEEKPLVFENPQLFDRFLSKGNFFLGLSLNPLN